MIFFLPPFQQIRGKPCVQQKDNIHVFESESKHWRWDGCFKYFPSLVQLKLAGLVPVGDYSHTAPREREEPAD